jgi:MFS family permease
VRRVVASMVVARLGGSMLQLTVVLFVLEHYRSPALAGLVGLAAGLSGILMSPLAGALLDRYGRVRLICVDYAVGVLTTVLVPVLAEARLLPAWLLVVLVGVSGLTLPLSASGGRALLPMLLARGLWDRSNALDSASYRAAAIAGPALAGTLVATFGSSRTMAAIGLTWIVAGLVLWPVAEPPGVASRGRNVVSEAVDGLRYVFHNRVLRRLSIVFPAGTLAAGALNVVLPVLVLTRMHSSPALVGLLWAAMGAGGLLSNLLMGGVRTEGRENRIMAAGFAGGALSLVLVALAPSAPVAAVGMALVGACNGPIDNAMFGLRVRAIEPAWFGRSISISMMLNSLGFPIGAGLGGALVGYSLPLALWLVCLGPVLGALLSLVLLRPASQPPPLPVLQSVGSPKP